MTEQLNHEQLVGAPASIRILIVDGQRSFAELLSRALTTSGAMTTVGIAGTAARAVGLAAQLRPDVIVLDINLPGQDGIATIRRMRASSPESIVAVVTTHTDPTWIAKAGRAGASAFVGKNSSVDEIIRVVQAARSGHLIVAPSLYAPAARVPTGTNGRPLLSHRELEVITLLARAMTVKEIAQALHLSEHTCRGYVKFVRQKLGVTSQLEAVVRAQQLGLIDPQIGT